VRADPRRRGRRRPRRAVLPEQAVMHLRSPKGVHLKFAFRAALLAALLALLASFAGCGGSVLPQIHSPEDRLPTAKRLFEKGNAQDAIDLLKVYVATGGGSADIDDAIYLLGRCYLKIKD